MEAHSRVMGGDSRAITSVASPRFCSPCSALAGRSQSASSAFIRTAALDQRPTTPGHSRRTSSTIDGSARPVTSPVTSNAPGVSRLASMPHQPNGRHIKRRCNALKYADPDVAPGCKTIGAVRETRHRDDRALIVVPARSICRISRHARLIASTKRLAARWLICRAGAAPGRAADGPALPHPLRSLRLGSSAAWARWIGYRKASRYAQGRAVPAVFPRCTDQAGLFCMP